MDIRDSFDESFSQSKEWVSPADRNQEQAQEEPGQVYEVVTDERSWAEIRSLGGWAAVKDMRKGKAFQKSDERILGGFLGTFRCAGVGAQF